MGGMGGTSKKKVARTDAGSNGGVKLKKELFSAEGSDRHPEGEKEIRGGGVVLSRARLFKEPGSLPRRNLRGGDFNVTLTPTRQNVLWEELLVIQREIPGEVKGFGEGGLRADSSSNKWERGGDLSPGTHQMMRAISRVKKKFRPWTKPGCGGGGKGEASVRRLLKGGGTSREPFKL